MQTKIITSILFTAVTATTFAQTYDSSTLVDTNSTSDSTVTSTNTNNNTNVNTNTSTSTSTSVNTNNNTNTNVNTSNSVNTNNNVNVNTSTSTSDNTNRNISSGEITNNNNNVSTSSNTNRNINSGDMTNRNINDSNIEQTVKSPPPTAVAPAMMSGGNSDLCTTGTSGAVQTQILGVSSGGTVRDLNCERLKNAKTLYDMGMKVAAVSTLCQDRRVFDAMWHAGTPCPYEGKIGEQARTLWIANADRIPAPEEKETDDFYKKASFGALLGWLLFIL